MEGSIQLRPGVCTWKLVHRWVRIWIYAPIVVLTETHDVAGWLYFWLRENFVASQILVTINTVAQLTAVAALPPLTPSSPMLHRLTHLVAKTFAGIGVLDFIDDAGVALVSSQSRRLHASTELVSDISNIVLRRRLSSKPRHTSSSRSLRLAHRLSSGLFCSMT